MGVCNTKEVTEEDLKQKRKERKDKHQSRYVDQQITEEQNQDCSVNKLLLLGAGGSGKSTLFKQMITIYGKGFPESERTIFTAIIYNNMIVSMKVLCENSDKFTQVEPQNQEAKRVMLEEVKEEHEVNDVIGNYIKQLWSDSGIQATYAMRSKFQLTDSASYFFNLEKVDEIMKPGYIPTEQDVLRSRVPTTGIVENAFDIDGNSFKMFDVGGQRSERKKWIHCFENVTAVLFVTAISSYDQVLYEDESTNRMQEALDLFEEITNSEWFDKTAMILFLNKRDLFAEKIEKVPLGDYFPMYGGNDTYDEATEFIQLMFEGKNQNHDKDVYTHITCATDTNNIFAVFNSVKDIIIRKGLTRAGLMV